MCITERTEKKVTASGPTAINVLNSEWNENMATNIIHMFVITAYVVMVLLLCEFNNLACKIE